MRIRVKGFLSLKGVMGGNGEAEVVLPSATLRQVLMELSSTYGEPFRSALFDPLTSDIRPENQVLVNGRHYRYLRNGLGSELQDGDQVALFPQVAGGVAAGLKR